MSLKTKSDSKFNIQLFRYFDNIEKKSLISIYFTFCPGGPTSPFIPGSPGNPA